MADECDRAQAIEAVYRQVALVDRPRPARGTARYYCEECGEPIPEARRRAVPGVRRCLACQEEADARHR